MSNPRMRFEMSNPILRIVYGDLKIICILPLYEVCINLNN